MDKMPQFFDDVKPIAMRDPLAKVLGSAGDGLITYSYADVVRLTGHSCPTTAGAYLMTRRGLRELYGDETPVRGEIKATIQGKLGDGVVGVIASVVSFVTGATADGGFHGLFGKYDRRHLLAFDPFLEAAIVLSRTDTGACIGLDYNPSIVSPSPQMGELLGKISRNEQNGEDAELFASLWQERVKKILVDFADDEWIVTTKTV